MSDLIAVAYPDKQTAETVRERLLQLTKQHVIEVLPEIQGYGGEVIQTSLDNESEARLREVLESSQATT